MLTKREVTAQLEDLGIQAAPVDVDDPIDIPEVEYQIRYSTVLCDVEVTE